jgi:WXXGXW repeat (2 copies)
VEEDHVSAEITRRTLVLVTVSGLLAGCIVAEPPVVAAPPPPPAVQVEAPPASPGPAYVWVPGHWVWRRRGYVWAPGFWAVPAAPGYVWAPGHWAPRGGGFVWIEGRWRAR